MKSPRISYSILAAATVLVFIFLAVQSQLINEEQYNRYRADLRQLETLHATLNENVLQARLGLLTYFDPLNATLNDLDSIREQLGNIPAFVSDQGQAQITASLSTYDMLMAQKRDFIEDFKTQYAVLRNSLSYFTIVVSDVAEQTGGLETDPVVDGPLNSLLQDVLLYSVTADEELIPVIEEHISRLEERGDAFATGSPTTDLDALVSHTAIILERNPIVEALIDDMFALPILSDISGLSRVYQADYEAAWQVTRFYQIALYAFSLAVVAYIAVIIITRLRRSAAVLTSATEKLQATNEELQKASREALEANRLKDEFLAVMSHELRTPLNAIIGFQGILLMMGNLDEKATHMIQRAQSNAERLLALITDILDISRIESGRLQLAPMDLSLAETVEKWRSQMSVLAEQKALDFSVHMDKALPPVIRVDEDAVTKVVTNLLGNAFKFTEEGEVSLALKRANGNWIIEVKDSGIGIPAHMHQVIFERFRQVDGSSKRKFGGSGLGLAIVHNLCKAMNGTVSLQSAPGEGSTFTVTLPLETQGRKVLF
jgi:signal transduction histidine kinase